jgi:hypothetical protein
VKFKLASQELLRFTKLGSIPYIIAGCISAIASWVGGESIFTLLQYSLLLTGLLALMFVFINYVFNVIHFWMVDFTLFTMPDIVSAMFGKWVFMIWVVAAIDVIVKLITHQPWM